jgi:hypothetical protein
MRSSPRLEQHVRRGRASLDFDSSLLYHKHPGMLLERVGSQTVPPCLPSRYKCTSQSCATTILVTANKAGHLHDASIPISKRPQTLAA